MTFIDLYLSHITLLGARGGNGAQPYRLAKMTSVRQFGPGWEPGRGVTVLRDSEVSGAQPRTHGPGTRHSAGICTYVHVKCVFICLDA